MTLNVILLILLPCSDCNIPVSFQSYYNNNYEGNYYALAEIKKGKVVNIYWYENDIKYQVNRENRIFKIYHVYDINSLPCDYKLNNFRRERLI